MSDLLENLVSERNATKLYVLAHSMGCNLLSETLNDMQLGGISKFNKFMDEIILAAPDIDKQRFHQIESGVKNTSNRITLYASEKDRALKFSKLLQGYQRAGGMIPDIYILDLLDSIDASSVGSDIFKHSYHATRSVLSDIHSILINDLSPEKRFSLEKVGTPPKLFWRFK